MQDIYKQKGYKDRADYLDSLADEYGVSKMLVYSLADMLGPSEDFDGLVSMIEDVAYM
jgi:hypothetical protein